MLYGEIAKINEAISPAQLLPKIFFARKNIIATFNNPNIAEEAITPN
jgi:hypothetical protein